MSPVNRGAAAALVPQEPVAGLAHEFPFSEADFRSWRSRLRARRHLAGRQQAQSGLQPPVAPPARARDEFVRRVSRVPCQRPSGNRELHQLDLDQPHQVLPRGAPFRSFPHACRACRSRSRAAGMPAAPAHLVGRLLDRRGAVHDCRRAEARDPRHRAAATSRILATDIDTDVLTKAARGEFAGRRIRRDSASLPRLFQGRRARRRGRQGRDGQGRQVADHASGTSI